MVHAKHQVASFPLNSSAPNLIASEILPQQWHKGQLLFPSWLVSCRCPVLSCGTAMQVSSQIMQYACTCLSALMCLCCSGAGRARAAWPCRMQAATKDTPSPAPVRAAVRYQGIHHAGFLVQDTAKSVEWYRSILGGPGSMPVPCFSVPRLMQCLACRHGGQRRQA